MYMYISIFGGKVMKKFINNTIYVILNGITTNNMINLL